MSKSLSPILNHFSFTHLTADLQDVSMPICTLAIELDRELEDNEEKQVGLRKLLEAKDCFVRSKLQSMAQAKQAAKAMLRAAGQYKGGTC